MTLISKSQPNLVGGVSQQPDSLRLENQCRIQENAVPSVIEGLYKRPPFTVEARLSSVSSPATYPSDSVIQCHWIDRDPQERYVVYAEKPLSASPCSIRVFDFTGAERTVTKVENNFFTVAEVNDYLTVTSVRDLKFLTVNDYTFILNTAKIPATAPELVPDPYPTSRGYFNIRQGSYKTNYEFSLRRTTQTAIRTLWFRTFNGNTTGTEVNERRAITLRSISQYPSDSLIGGAYTLRIASTVVSVGNNDFTFNYSGGSTNGPERIMLDLARQINAAGIGYFASVENSGYSLFTDVGTTNKNYAELRITRDGTTAGGFTLSWQAIPGTLGTHYQTETVLHCAYTDDEVATIDTSNLADKVLRFAHTTGFLSSSVHGSVVGVSGGSTDNVAFMSSNDGVSGTMATAVWEKVNDVDDLPPIAFNGEVVRVSGSTEANEDDYYVEFDTGGGNTLATGTWRETARPGSLMRMTNLPLVLVRQNDGTFKLQGGDWLDRQVGDDVTNPFPSFVAVPQITEPVTIPATTGQPITDVFFHKNRLGLLTASGVVMSEAGVYFNLFKANSRSVLDSDPIDIQAAHTSVSSLTHAVPHNERLLLFSDRTQFVVSGTPLLTPKTASIQYVSSYECNTDASPVTLGRNVYFGAKSGEKAFISNGYASIWEMQQLTEDITVGAYQASSITGQIPRYMAGSATLLVPCPDQETMFVKTDLATINMWKFFINGQNMIQSAWSKFTFALCDIVSFNVYDSSRLYALVRLNTAGAGTSQLFLVSMDLLRETQIPLLDFSVYANTVATASFDGTHTTISYTSSLAYLHSSNYAVQVVHAGTGQQYACTYPTSSSIRIAGDLTVALSSLILGVPYTMRYQFGRIDVRESTDRGGSAAVKTGRYQNLFGVLKYANTNNFTVTTQINQEAVKSMQFVASKGNDGTTPWLMDNGEYRFPTLTRTDNLTVEVLNATPYPCTLIGAEWIANFTTNFPRLRAQ